MSEERPSALRVRDPGIRALLARDARWQAWLDVEVALARAQAAIGMIPVPAATEIERKARLDLFDLDRVTEGLRVTGHGLVPLVWELDRLCEGDAGGYVHWGATTQNITQTGNLLQVRKAHRIVLTEIAALLEAFAGLAERTKDHAIAGRTHGQHAVPSTSAPRSPCGSTSCAATRSGYGRSSRDSSSRCSAAARARPPRSRATAPRCSAGWASCWGSARCRCPAAPSTTT